MALPRGLLPAAALVGVLTATLVGVVLVTGGSDEPGPPISPAVVVTPVPTSATTTPTGSATSRPDDDGDDDPTEVPPSVETLDDDA